MNRNLLIFTRGTSLVAGLLLAANGLAQAPAPAPVAPAAPVAAADDSTAPPTVDLNSPLPGEIRFHGAPVQAVLEYYADLTKRSIIAAPNLAGTIYFTSKTRLTVGEAIQALDSVLAINNIAIVPLGDKFLKVVQMNVAKQEAPPLRGEEEILPPSDTLLTQIIALEHVEAAEMVATLQPYMHSYGQLLPLGKSNSILVTDTAANINQMQEIIRYVDRPSQMRMETKVYTIQNARAAEIVQQLQQIIQQAEQLGGPTAAPGRPRVPTVRRRSTPPAPAPKGAVMIEGKVIITADERTNKIFVLSRPANFEFFDNLVAELDAQVEPDVITRVVALDYANAEELASQLNALITGGTLSLRSRTSTRPGAPPPPPTPAAAVSGAGGAGAAGFLEYSEGVRILPDPRTNSLLLLASRQDIERLEQLIKSIDTAVAQVLIEVVIAEVKLDNTLDVGVEMVKRMFKEGQVIQTGSTGAGVPGQPPADLGSLYPDTELLGGLAEDAAPLALAAASGGLTHFLTFKNLKLDAVIRLMSTSSKFKVLSTPIIQTLHNQEASIIVGESRPVITSTVSDINSSDSTAVRSSVEYKDIAIELTVTPRINPDGYVTMDIEQKINDFGGNIKVNGVDVPIITKREAKSAVTVKTDSTIVLGGMIREDRGLTESKVPFLGDLPLFGLLFKDKSATKNRTELIVFIRPRVLRNDDEAVAEARLRSERLKAGAELELERMFEEPGAEPGAQLGTEDPAAGPSESTESARTAKVKALQETTKKPNQP